MIKAKLSNDFKPVFKMKSEGEMFMKFKDASISGSLNANGRDFDSQLNFDKGTKPRNKNWEKLADLILNP